MTYIDPISGKQVAATDPRTLATPEARIAAAQAAQAAFEDAFGLKFRPATRLHLVNPGCPCAICNHS